MAEVTVNELAKIVGASVDRLLTQMKEAGLSHDSADATVSDEEKQVLLGYLKSLHGGKSSEPKKIVLRRKTVSTLKSGNRKTVNIEVRKKRTYVKRSEEEIKIQAKAEAEEKARQDEATAVESGVASGVDDIEEKRQSAIEKRRQAEIEAARKAEEAEKAKLEEEARKAAEAAATLESEEAKKAAKTVKVNVPPAEPAQDRGRRNDKSIDDDDDLIAKKAAKKPSSKTNKKNSRIQLDDGIDEKEAKLIHAEGTCTYIILTLCPCK